MILAWLLRQNLDVSKNGLLQLQTAQNGPILCEITSFSANGKSRKNSIKVKHTNTFSEQKFLSQGCQYENKLESCQSIVYFKLAC